VQVVESSHSDYAPDVLPGFEARSLRAATLVRPTHQPSAPRAALLHVHGYNDYFFHVEFARAMLATGIAFYAEDLARAGRSLRPGEHPHDMLDAAEQGADITDAMDAIAAELPGVPVIVHGHSTGGLTASVWAHDSPHPALAGLALNSPLFGLAMRPHQRAALPIVLAALRRHPERVVVPGRSPYAERLHVSGGGSWEFNTEWKRPAGVDTRASWLGAVQRAIARLSRGLDIRVPVFVARSAQAGRDSHANGQAGRQDTVVDVAAIARLAPRLGSQVTSVVIEGGLHDLVLSEPDARADYLDRLTAWIDTVCA